MYRKRSDYTRSNKEGLRLIGTDGITRIAICGKLRSGKSALADHLTFEYGFTKMSFGAELKRQADELFADSEVFKTEETRVPDIFGGTRVVSERKPRELYQRYGQAMRTLDPDVWVNQLARTADALTNMRSTTGLVIEDTRQPNELEWCKQNGYTIIRVTAPEGLRIERATALGDDFDTESLTHETEMHVDGFVVDYEINNDGSKADLLARVDEIVDDIRTKGRD